jgi:hypothetical protein
MGSNTPVRNRIQRTAAVQKLIDGLNKNAATVPSFFMDGVVLARADIITRLQGLLDATSSVETARAEWLHAVTTNARLWRDDASFLSGLRTVLLVGFHSQVNTLADFGLTRRKVGALSPEAKVAVTVKGQATRAARHTMGKNQKKAIVGTPPAYAVVDVTGGSSAAPAPAPTTQHTS